MNRKDLPPANMTCEVCGRKYRRCKTCAQMHSRGIETWREHCDSVECYMTLVLSQTEPSKVTLEEYNNVINLELPEGRKPVEDIQSKLDAIKTDIDNREKTIVKTSTKISDKVNNKADDSINEWKDNKSNNEFKSYRFSK